jgi:hypothetical protein
MVSPHIQASCILQLIYVIDCTPKAVSHRLNNIRNHGKPLAASTGTTPVKAATTPKTPRSRVKASAKKSRAAAGTSESDNGEPEGLLESPSVKRGSVKRPHSAPKVSYAETDGSDVMEEYTPFGGVKRVKKEPVEEQDDLDVSFAVEEV